MTMMTGYLGVSSARIERQVTTKVDGKAKRHGLVDASAVEAAVAYAKHAAGEEVG